MPLPVPTTQHAVAQGLPSNIGWPRSKVRAASSLGPGMLGLIGALTVFLFGAAACFVSLLECKLLLVITSLSCLLFDTLNCR